MEKQSPERIKFLTDGVLAIIMTLLVLELSLPLIAGKVDEVHLSKQLLLLLPNCISYIVSFLILSLFWMLHSGIFENVKSIGNRGVWINLLFLMFIAVLPFTSTIAAEHWHDPISVIVYGLNWLIPLLLMNALSHYLNRRAHLLHQKIDLNEWKKENRATWTIAILILVGIGLSFTSTLISYVLFGLLALFYLIMGWFEKEGFIPKKSSD